MNYRQARCYLLDRPEAWEDFPFGPNIAVMKIHHKMFGTLAVQDGFLRAYLKCDPDEALIMRDIFTGVIPGYHRNKRHWNTVFSTPTCRGAKSSV